MSVDLSQFKATYITECLELLADMEERLLGLSEQATREELDAIFRCAHSIKGGAGAFGFTKIAQFTHVLEALLDQVREGKIAATREVIDLLLKARDAVLNMVVAARDGTNLAENFAHDLAEALAKLAGQPAHPSAAKTTTTQSAGSERYSIEFAPHREMMTHGSDPLPLLRELSKLGQCTVSLDASALPMLDGLTVEHSYLRWSLVIETTHPESALREVFEFVEDECDLSITLMSKETVAAAPTQAANAVSAPIQPGGASIRVDIDKVDRLINMVGEIVITQAMLLMQTRHLAAPEHQDLVSGITELAGHTRELQEAVMAVRMQPVKSIFARMPRLVRDLSAQLGKDIRLVPIGEQTEVDKTIIEQLSDPLTHMIRNSIDHGLEKPDVRTQNGKNPQGTIYLSASHRGGKIVIEVRDDGAGINRERVLSKARERGLVAPDATLSDTEIDQLIFAPGFSTAEQVTNISGRGVGMDVVKRNIESIGGVVHVANNPGQGASFTIFLPLTLAILDGMIVRVAEEHYIVPIASIIETLRPKPEDVRALANGESVINVRGAFVPVLYLHRLFGISGAVEDASRGLVVLVECGSEQIGLVVDELVGQQQVVIKSLEENTDPIPGISGATILGDGKVSLILDITGLRRLPHPASPIRQAA